MSERYFEDFVVGQINKPSGRVRVEKDDIIAFAKKFDPQPFHLDEEAGRKSIFGRLVASGWHTAALTMSLVARANTGRPAAPSAWASTDCVGRFRFTRRRAADRNRGARRCGRRSRGPIAA